MSNTLNSPSREYIPTVPHPNSLAALRMRVAISPRFAAMTLSKGRRPAATPSVVVAVVVIVVGCDDDDDDERPRVVASSS
jgi:hypothetical protein